MVPDKIYDYIIVGTGPGGATVAKELASQEKHILLVEYGPRVSSTGFTNLTKLSNEQYSVEGMQIGRARLLGGSSYTAMGNAVTPPPSIIGEWGVDLSEELESARNDLRVNPMPKRLMGPGTRRINEAAASLGWEMKQTPKCVDFTRCTACGMCMFGCPRGAKWTALEFVDEAGTEIVHRIPERGSGDFRIGSQVIVRDSQAAVFFRDGRALDTFGPGPHTITTANIPLLVDLVGKAFSGETPFKAEVYFVSLR